MLTDFSVIVSRLVNGLKSRNEEDRWNTLRELYRVVGRELKEISVQSYVLCLDLLCNELLVMFSSGEIWEKKGAVLAMGCLTEVDFMSIHNHCGRFATHLLNAAPTTDIQLAAMEARLVGQFGLVFPYDFIEERIERACDMLSSEYSDPQKQFQILILRELVLNTPTSFYQQFGLFMKSIAFGFRDKNAITRELAGITLHSAFSLAASREQRLHGPGGFTSSDISRGADESFLDFVESSKSALSGSLPGSRHASVHGSGLTPAENVFLHGNDKSAPAVSWYRNCLIEALRPFGASSMDQPTDSVPHGKKLSRDDWIHGSMLLMSELLACVEPKYEELLDELNEMAGLPLFEFLTTNPSESVQAVRTATSSRWSSLRAPSALISTGLLPGLSPLASDDYDPTSEVLGLDADLNSESRDLGCSRKQGFSGLPSALCQRLLLENIDKLWTTVSSWLTVRNQQLVVLLFKILPRLVALSPHQFLKDGCHQPIMEWLFQWARKGRERSMAVITVALIGNQMGSEFAVSGYLSQFLALVRSLLPARRDVPAKKRSATLETAAILSVGVLVKALGQSMCESVNQILDAMIASGLNQPLIATCKVLTEHIPQLRKEIQDRILSDISLVLQRNSSSGQMSLAAGNGSSLGLANTPHLSSMLSSLMGTNSSASGLPITHTLGVTGSQTTTSNGSTIMSPVSSGVTVGSLGGGSSSLGVGQASAPRISFAVPNKNYLSRPSSSGFPYVGMPASGLSTVAIPGGLLASGEPSTDIAVVALALRTLGSFNFEGHPLAHFVRHISDNFISLSTCEIKEIRLEAVKTCARLMLPWLKSVESHHWYARPAVNTVADILGKLLTVGVSDSDPDVRRCVFESIDQGFDTHLAQAEHLSSLFLALHDERFDIRCLVMQRIGRLSEINPACVQPNLRKVLLHNLTNLAHSGSTKNKEHSALLLTCLIASAPRFFTPYAEPLIQILVPRIRQALPASLKASLTTSTISRLQRARTIFDYDRSESSFSSLRSENAGPNPHAMQCALLATQVAANAAAVAAHAVATAAAIPPVGSGGGWNQQPQNRFTSAKRPQTGSSNQGLSNGPGSNTVAMVTGAAAAAAAAAAVVIGVAGQNAEGLATKTLEGFSSAFAHAGLPFDVDFGIGLTTNDTNGLFERFGLLNLDLGPDFFEDPSAHPGGQPTHLGISGQNLPYSQLTYPSFGTPLDLRALTNTNPTTNQWTEPNSVVIALFTTLGRLSAIAPYGIRAYMDEFIPILCYMMQDSACLARRSIAVWTLSKLVTNTGCVVSPYRCYPELLEILFGMLKREESRGIRQEVLRALGLLGALDPFKFKLYSGQVDTFGDTGVAVSLYETDEKKDVDITQSELVVSLSWENRDVFFSVCALSALIRTLRDPALRSQYANIVQTIVYVLKLLGPRSVYYLRQLMPDYFACLQNTRDARLQEFLIRQLGSIMTVVQLNTKEFAHEVVSLLTAHWWIAPNVQNACIGLLSPMSAVLGAEFRPYLTRLIPVILRTFTHESSEANLIALLEVLPEFGYTLEDHVHILVPAIANLIDVTSEDSLLILLKSATDPVLTTGTVSANENSPDGLPSGSCDHPVRPSIKISFSDPLLESFDPVGSVQSVPGSSSQVAATNTASQPLNFPVSAQNVGAANTSASRLTGDGLIGSVQLRRACLECLARFTDRLDLDDLAGQIVHPICRLLLTLEACYQRFQHLLQHHHHTSSSLPSSTKSAATLGTQAAANAINSLHPAAVDVLTGLLLRMGQKFRLLLPVVQKMLNSLHLRTPRFYTILGRVEKGAYLPTTSDQVLANITSIATQTRNQRPAPKEPDPTSAVSLLPTNGGNLERAWRSSHMASRDDWDQWLKTLTTTLLRESPSPAIRACSQLSAISPVIGRILFNAAFVSCWPQLTIQQQDDLINTLELVLRVSDQSPEVSQTILNLEEFMAHVDKYSVSSPRVPLPLSLSVLSDRAMKNRAYAKALYYKEQEFLEELQKRSSPSPATLLCLLTIYSKLQLEEAAIGVYRYAKRNPQDKLVNEEVWDEMLHDWKNALNHYERKLEDERIRDKSALILGRMRCLRALGDWTPLNAMAWERWDQVNDSMRTRMAPLACSAAWATNSWDRMERYLSALPTDHNFDGSFYRAILAIHSDKYSEACQYILNARSVLDAELTTMSEESYDRAYADLVGAQLLSEAEEVIQYKLLPQRRTIIREAWQSRLRGCQSVVEDWNQIIQLRSLVLEPCEDLKTRLRFAGLCRRSGRFILARQLLENLLGQDPARIPQNEVIPGADPAVVFAYTKLLWATGAQEEAVTRLCVLKTNVLEPMLRTDSNHVSARQPASGTQLWPPPAFSSSDALDNWDFHTPAAQAAVERQTLRSLMAKCCLRLGMWYSELYTPSPPGCNGADAGYATSFAQPNNNGLQSSFATARRLSRTGAFVVGGSSGSETLPNSLIASKTSSVGVSATSGGRAPLLSSGQTRKAASTNGNGNNGLLGDSGVVNVTQAWEESQAFVIQCYRAATVHAPDNRFAWQSWAMANYAVFNHLDSLKARLERAEIELTKVNSGSPAPHAFASVPSPLVTTSGNLSPLPQPIAELARAKADLQRCMELHAAPSVRGFVNSVSLSPSANLQDSLRLINLLFKFGHLAEIREVIREGLTKIRLDNWLLVIQQLLARIDTTREYVASIIIDLLISVGQRYPQSMVYPLVLSFKSGGSDRRRYNANRILYSMEEHSPRLVSEAFLLNEELIRLSITWVEMWSESLEDASRVYFGEKDIAKMFRLLHPLHQMMDRGHETIHEATFLQEHGNELANCRACCESFERTLAKVVLQQAWEGYYTLYRRFSKQVNSMTMLELSVASPRLHEYRQDWQLAVPGSYEPHRPLVRIAGIKNCLPFMTSKQHPRKLTVLGSNGHQYVFLLKGHEDTRQDERVMQFFGLVNTLLMNNSETLRRNLTIQRMSVIPLSTNTGLIGWVPNSDTLHSLIRDYREKTSTVLNKENREMLRLAPDFDRLNVIQKTEIFEAGLRESSGRDLANILWLKSHSSEAWFERRTNFVRSMAIMSMVGYILGLGDRHPSNIMLSRETGKVVHIDFGDCFEVAMMREKFPEKVPFRLTRMIIAAMEVTGIDGVYRNTCEMVMSLMRTNRESLLAVLEAFIHDPLLQWVLLENRKDFNHLDNKLDDMAGVGGATGAAIQMNANGVAAPGIPTAMAVNGGAPGVAQAQQMKTGTKPSEPHHRQHQYLNAQTTTAYRPTDRTGGLAPPNATHFQQQNHYEHQLYQPQQQQAQRGGRRSGSPIRVFTNPNHPDSASLRDPHKVNPWRHHLCNGPWFGCYETAKRLRKQTESGHIIVERQGLQGFIFSAKPPTEEESTTEAEAYPATLGNTRARAVMEKIRQKLTGTERDHLMDVSSQVDHLIREATSNENLCQMYMGWCAFW
ncbi:unnamed protein product [Calicophoron daubneyi]|uniref:non-specific serine/threonine protein kinase n=1 Tax=Calicophoron daubneyi TaxID=300641 RepID=A0AAV2TNP2_CALDB